MGPLRGVRGINVEDLALIRSTAKPCVPCPLAATHRRPDGGSCRFAAVGDRLGVPGQLPCAINGARVVAHPHKGVLTRNAKPPVPLVELVRQREAVVLTTERAVGNPLSVLVIEQVGNPPDGAFSEFRRPGTVTYSSGAPITRLRSCRPEGACKRRVV
jgi:hypothetical protein